MCRMMVTKEKLGYKNFEQLENSLGGDGNSFLFLRKSKPYKEIDLYINNRQETGQIGKMFYLLIRTEALKDSYTYRAVNGVRTAYNYYDYSNDLTEESNMTWQELIRNLYSQLDFNYLVFHTRLASQGRLQEELNPHPAQLKGIMLYQNGTIQIPTAFEEILGDWDTMVALNLIKHYRLKKRPFLLRKMGLSNWILVQKDGIYVVGHSNKMVIDTQNDLLVSEPLKNEKRDWKDLKGIYHLCWNGKGYLADGKIEKQTPINYKKTWGPKRHGYYNYKLKKFIWVNR